MILYELVGCNENHAAYHALEVSNGERHFCNPWYWRLWGSVGPSCCRL